MFVGAYINELEMNLYYPPQFLYSTRQQEHDMAWMSTEITSTCTLANDFGDLLSKSYCEQDSHGINHKTRPKHTVLKFYENRVFYIYPRPLFMYTSNFSHPPPLLTKNTM